MQKPSWLEHVERELGRPLRVLHLGNVANNAYLNAKIMRRSGVDADAMSYDYYHVMGTPEWEDCDFGGDYGDAFFPDWWRVRLNGFQRPDWFIQGRKDLCRDLVRLRRKNSSEADAFHHMLNFDVQYICYRTSPLFIGEKRLRDWPAYVWRRLAFYVYALGFLLRRPKPAYMFIKLRRPLLAKTLAMLVTTLSLPALLLLYLFRALQERGRSLFGKSERAHQGEADDAASGSVQTTSQRRRRRNLNRARRVMFEREVLQPLVRDMQFVGSVWFERLTRRKFSDVFGVSFGEMLLPSLREEARRVRGEKLEKFRALDHVEETTQKLSRVSATEDALADNQERLYRYVRTLIHIHRRLSSGELKQIRKVHSNRHPDIDDTRLAEDLSLAYALSDGWDDVFSYYDVVQCYAVDCMIPFGGGFRDYVAYEHGTLRSIPFQDTPVGRLSNTGYAEASRVMVTNLDNLIKCDLMELTDKQVVPLPHAMDDTKILDFAREHADVVPDNSKPPLFLSPSRQDWVDSDLNFAKGNDVFLRAIKILTDEGFEMRIMLVEWGRHIAESKALIAELGIERFITWVHPMKKADLWRAYLRAHAVVDQFIIPAFGSVTFEALTLGKRVISRVDTQLATRFFGECPPMLTCSTPETVANAMRLVLVDPEDRIGEIGRKTAEWARRYHSSQTILDLQFEAYREQIQRGLKLRRRLLCHGAITSDSLKPIGLMGRRELEEKVAVSLPAEPSQNREGERHERVSMPRGNTLERGSGKPSKSKSKKAA